VQSLQQHLRELRGRNVEDGAVLVLDNATGAVLAWVGSSGALSQASEVDGVLALRQPGSTLKPFLYAQAIAERGSRRPRWWMTRPRRSPRPAACTSRRTTTAVQGLGVGAHGAGGVAQCAGGAHAGDGHARCVSPPAEAVGLPLRESGDYFGYSLALGSPEVPLLHLTNAFRTLANGGRFSPVAPWRRRAGAKPAFTPALDARAAFIVGDILSDGNARARTFGTDSVLATRFWSAVKTGTSKDMRDNWAVGWSERYTVGVWVGNASGAAMHDVSGTSGAAPMWAAVMGFLHAREPSRAPAPAAGAGAGRRAVWPGTAGDAQPAAGGCAHEWFVPGTQQALFAIDSIAALMAPKRPKISAATASAHRGQKLPGAAPGR
jgi:penicillin-binding protein 1C